MNNLTIVASNRNRLDINSPASQLFLKSLQWQTYTNFEVLIVDGGSNNYNELQDYFSKNNCIIKINIIQHKIGEAFLRALLNNVGIRNAQTPYIACTDVDMCFGKDFIKTAMSNFNEKSFVESRTMYWKENVTNAIYAGKLDPLNDLDSCKSGRIKKQTTAGGFQGTHINNWNILKAYNEDMCGWGSEDFELLTRAQRLGLNVRWMGENNDIMLFHQPHAKDTKKDLEYQENNKKILEQTLRGGNKEINVNGWGGKE
jgi:glycosyltransferase involved in cell wall biosynthesis